MPADRGRDVRAGELLDHLEEPCVRWPGASAVLADCGPVDVAESAGNITKGDTCLMECESGDRPDGHKTSLDARVAEVWPWGR